MKIGNVKSIFLLFKQNFNNKKLITLNNKHNLFELNNKQKQIESSLRFGEMAYKINTHTHTQYMQQHNR